MAARGELARARLQAQLNKKKNETGAIEALDKQREKLLTVQTHLVASLALWCMHRAGC